MAAQRNDITLVELKKIACEEIDKYSKELHELNHNIWSNPECNYKESICHGILTDFFKKHNFHVIPNWTLDTAFSAKSSGHSGPCVGILCEYDALPVVGHACGHNLIAEAGAAAALGIKAALEKTENKLGRLHVIGSPAEEGGGGKVKMIQNGCFENIDFCMMVHPCPYDGVYFRFLDLKQVDVTYIGVSAHAAAFPWQGVNALDAAVMAYSSINAMRQQMKPTWRVHGVILDGGQRPSVIPGKAKLQYFLRTPNKYDMEDLEGKMVACFEAAAKATGCTVELDWNETGHYRDVKVNPTLASLYRQNAKTFGVQFMPGLEEAHTSLGSTDMGNVSHTVPSIHPVFSIGTNAPNHSAEFTTAAGTQVAHEKTIIAAKVMALTSLEVLYNSNLLEKVKRQFTEAKSAR